MLVAVSFFRAGSHHRDMPHAERFSSLLAIRAVTMVDGLPRAASAGTIGIIDGPCLRAMSGYAFSKEHELVQVRRHDAENRKMLKNQRFFDSFSVLNAVHPLNAPQ